MPSCKTEHLAGGEHRFIPLFPEVLPYLRDVFEAAEPGTVYVVTRYRQPNVNLRTQLLRVMRRASVSPWPKLFHNLRASRQTELEETYPTHAVCAWSGNSEIVAHKHYLQVRDAHFDRANSKADAGVTGAAQNPAQHPHERGRTATNVVDSSLSKPLVFRVIRQVAERCKNRHDPNGTRTRVASLKGTYPNH